MGEVVDDEDDEYGEHEASMYLLLSMKQIWEVTEMRMAETWRTTKLGIHVYPGTNY